MLKHQIAFSTLVLSSALLAGCDSLIPNSTGTSGTNNATASLKVMVQPTGTYDASASWDIQTFKTIVAKVAVMKNGSKLGEADINSPETDIAYPKRFRSKDILAGTYDGLTLTLGSTNAEVIEYVNRTQYDSPSSTRSVPVIVNNPLSFSRSLEIPANKRMVLLFKPDYRKIGEPGAFALTASSMTIEPHLQELVSSNGYPMAYLSHFALFSFADPDGNTEFSEMDLHPGPYIQPNNAAGFNSEYENSEQLKQFADLGEKALSAVTAVPASDQFTEQVAIIPGHCYVKKTRTGNWAKFRVISLASDWMDNIDGIPIEYYVQGDGASTFSK